ncbi:MAG: hypothetical protein IPO31_15125 [Candidatus Obscuribacter sp.]|nr:hypothetical protein [Candidatus Obscuribacter sp.]
MLHTFAYILMYFIQEARSAAGNDSRNLQTSAPKIGVLVEQKCREVRLHLASEFAWRDQFPSRLGKHLVQQSSKTPFKSGSCSSRTETGLAAHCSKHRISAVS